MKKFFAWLKGKKRRDFLENLSYVLLVASAILIGIGVLFGVQVKYLVFLAAIGAFLVIPAIAIYIFSQLFE